MSLLVYKSDFTTIPDGTDAQNIGVEWDRGNNGVVNDEGTVRQDAGNGNRLAIYQEGTASLWTSNGLNALSPTPDVDMRVRFGTKEGSTSRATIVFRSTGTRTLGFTQYGYNLQYIPASFAWNLNIFNSYAGTILSNSTVPAEKRPADSDNFTMRITADGDTFNFWLDDVHITTYQGANLLTYYSDYYSKVAVGPCQTHGIYFDNVEVRNLNEKEVV